jgi:hypothetical protein
MVAIDYNARTREPRARRGGRFAPLRINGLVSAELDEQTQQRGNNVFPRKNQYRGHSRSKGDTYT